MPRKPGPAPTALSRTNAARSGGQSSPGSKRPSFPYARTSRLLATTIAQAYYSSDTCERGERWVDSVPVWARRRKARFLPFQPEKMTGRLMQAQSKSSASVAARVLGLGGAKTRKTWAQAPPPAAQTGAKAAEASVDSLAPETLLRASGPVEHVPLRSVIPRFSKELDQQFRKPDVLE